MTPLNYIGIALIAAAAIIGFRQYSFIQSAKSAEGTVVSIEKIETKNERKGGNKKLAENVENVPTIEFMANSGQKTVFKVNGYTNTGLKVGDKVKVLYDPSNPEKAIINDTKFAYSLPLILAGIGILLTIIGFGRK